MHEQCRRRSLPHWDISGGTYFVTCCLAGSIPASGQRAIRKAMDRIPSSDRFVEEQDHTRESRSPFIDFAEHEHRLDSPCIARWLADRRLACTVRDAMLYFANNRYELLAYTVMPSHVHWVFKPLPAWVAGLRIRGERRTAREVVLHSFCRHTGLVCNRMLGRAGRFWQHESYDRVVRNDEELQRTVEYIEFNPVKAGLCTRSEEWEFSSAWGGGSMASH